MKQNKYLLVILLISCSLFAMEEPAQVPRLEPGVFLDKIVSEHEKPVTIRLMWLEQHYSGDWFVAENSSSYASIVAVAWQEKTLINEPRLKTQMKITPYGNDKFATIREVACLRIEDVLSNARKDVWIRKYLKHQQYEKKRGCFFVNGKTVEEFDFDHDQLSHTLVTLNLKNHKFLKGFNDIDVTVTSKTTCLHRKYELDYPLGGTP